MRVLIYPDRRLVENSYLTLLTDGVPGVDFEDWSMSAVLKRYDIVHLHWPEVAWRSHRALVRWTKGTLLIAALIAARLRGAQVVQTIHNVTPHDGIASRSSQILHALLRRMVTAIHVMDATTIDRLNGQYDGVDVGVIPHGHYQSDFDAPDPRPGPPFGIFHVGFLRPYKGTEELIEIFVEAGAQDWKLLIGGEPPSDERCDALMASMAGVNGEFHAGFLTKAEITALASRCHLAVFPFRDIENSGSVLLALSLGLPVLAPDIGGLAALQKRIGADWIELYRPPLTAAVLRQALDGAAQRDPFDRPDLSPLSWETIRAELGTWYETLAQSPGNTGAS